MLEASKQGPHRSRLSELKRCVSQLCAGLAKVYCSRHHAQSQRATGQPFPAFEDDADAWVKARWNRGDAARVVAAALDAASALPGNGGTGGPVVEVEMELTFGPRRQREAGARPLSGRAALAVAAAAESDGEEEEAPSDLAAVVVTRVWRAEGRVCASSQWAAVGGNRLTR